MMPTIPTMRLRISKALPTSMIELHISWKRNNVHDTIQKLSACSVCTPNITLQYLPWRNTCGNSLVFTWTRYESFGSPACLSIRLHTRNNDADSIAVSSINLLYATTVSTFRDLHTTTWRHIQVDGNMYRVTARISHTPTSFANEIPQSKP